MTRRAMDTMLEQLHRHVQTPEGRAALVRRICTPLTEEEYRRGMERGILTDPAMLTRDHLSGGKRGGHRVCDLQYDTESEERTLIFKLGGLRTEIPLRDLDRSFEDLIGDITDLDLKN